MIEQRNERQNAALDYAQRGWHVFPCHSPINGRCSCGDPNCADPAKHPRFHKDDLRNGLNSATTDAVVIERWWTRWPDANVGVRTGKISGIVVMDIDAKSSGLESWQDIQDFNGRVDTLTSHTGGGGLHLFFEAPAKELKSTASQIAQGVDTRAEGGYVVLPPSLHISGRRYRWEGDDDDADID